MNLECTFKPTFDSIANTPESIVNYILVGLEGLIGIFIFYNLIKLCKRSFSYRKDGIYETIQFHVICLATLLIIILTRFCELWFYQNDERKQSATNSQNFTNLLAELTILFVNDIYLYGSIVWFRLIYESEQIKKFKMIKKIIKVAGIYVMNPIIVAVITYLHLFQQNYMLPSLIIILIVSFIVEFVFIFASMKLLSFWNQYEFSQNNITEYVKYFRYILWGLLFFSISRIILFLVKIIFQVKNINIRNFDTNTCEDLGFSWAISMFFYSFFVSIMPILLFLILFKYRVNIKEEGLYMSNIYTKSYIYN